MKSNLEVWAVQNQKEDFETALKNIKPTSRGNILYSNCVTRFCIGDQRIKSKEFDTALVSPENDALILFMRNGIATVNDVRNYLNKKKIRYHEVAFKEPLVKPHLEKSPSKELWFAREKYVLEDAIEDSKIQGNDTCTYYPKVKGLLQLGYLTETDEFIEVEGRKLHGLIEFPDKIVAVINQRNKRNMKELEVYETLTNNSIATNVEFTTNKRIEPSPKGKIYQKH